MQNRLKKYSREKPENLPHRQITERSINIIEIFNNYKFLPTSMIFRLIDGNNDITARHLQNLYHQGLINRFAFPGLKNHSEFFYYLDDKRALVLLINHGHDAETLDFDLVKRNKDKAYYLITTDEHSAKSQGRLMFLSHEIMISRFHFLLETACRKTSGQVQLIGFYQGAQIWNTIEAPKVHFDSQGNMKELDEIERLPHRPDAFFALHYPNREGEKTDYYFYEADRKTTNSTKHNKKLRAHFHYIVKQKKHIEDYGVKRINAVLIESIGSHWANHLRESARHPIVSGSKPSPLFYFTTSEIFEQKTAMKIKGKEQEISKYLDTPELVFQNIWATPLDDDERPEFKSILNYQVDAV